MQYSWSKAGTIALSSDDDLVAGIGHDLVLFRMEAGAQIEMRLQGHTAEVGSIAFSKDGK